MGAPPFLLGTYICWQRSPLAFFPRAALPMKRSTSGESRLVWKKAASIRPAAYLPRRSLSTMSLVTFTRYFVPLVAELVPFDGSAGSQSSRGTGNHDVVLIFAGTGGRPSPRENS